MKASFSTEKGMAMELHILLVGKTKEIFIKEGTSMENKVVMVFITLKVGPNLRGNVKTGK